MVMIVASGRDKKCGNKAVVRRIVLRRLVVIVASATSVEKPAFVTRSYRIIPALWMTTLSVGRRRISSFTKGPIAAVLSMSSTALSMPCWVDDRIERVTSPTGDYDPVAARGELHCERASDTRSAAGDKDRVSRQFHSIPPFESRLGGVPHRSALAPSLRRVCEMSAMRARTSAGQACGSTSLSLAV
jgi:hypothetical protein